MELFRVAPRPWRPYLCGLARKPGGLLGMNPLARTFRTLRPLLLAGGLAALAPARAAHYSGGSITYECLGGNQYLFHLDLFLDCAGFQIVSQELTFTSDCGTTFTLSTLAVPAGTEVSQLCPAALAHSTCNGGTEPGIMHYQFDAQITLSACDGWTVAWDICCRNTTINVAGLPSMHIEALLNTATAPCNDSPVFTDQSLPYVCANEQVSYNFGVTEPDGDSLVYSLVSAQQIGPPATPVVYNPGYGGTAPIPGIVLDPVTGQLTFTPTLVGNYVVVLQVAEYDANGALIGTVMRDILFVVLNCTNPPPVVGPLQNNTAGLLVGTNAIEVCEGEPFCVDLVFSDPDPATVLQVSSQAAALLPGSTVSVAGTNPAVVTLCWTGDPAFSPVNVLFEANDGTCPIVNTVSTSVNIVSNPGGPMPDPGTDAALPLCAPVAPVPLFNALGGTPAAGGTWTGPNGLPHGPSFDPATDAPGAYTYTVGNACATVSATVTVSLVAQPDPGTNGVLALCSTDAPASLAAQLGGTPDPGGNWTGPSPVAGALYDPATMAPGTYTYTVAGVAPCPNATADVVVTEPLAVDAGSDGALSFCGSTGSGSLFAALGPTAQSGGAWSGPSPVVAGTYDAATMAPGAYTYTVIGPAPCLSDQATVTVTESPAPDAGLPGTVTVCGSGTPVALLAQLGGTPQVGGTWAGPSAVSAGQYDPATMVPGVYTYTVTGTAPCPDATATVSVIQAQPVDAGIDAAFVVCSDAAPADLLPLLGSTPQPGGTWSGPSAVVAGQYDPSTMMPGVYVYTVAGNAPCPDAAASVTVTEQSAPVAGTDAAITVCDQGAPLALLPLLAGAQPGGSWSAPGGGAFSGTYDPAADAPGIYTYSVAGAAPCLADQAIVTVVETANPFAGADAVLALCGSGAPADLFVLLAGAQPGGTWTGPGGAPFGGVYDPALHAGGVYTYALGATPPCVSDQATVTVTEVAPADAGADAAITVCSTGPATGLFALLAGAQPVGAWTAPGGGPFGGTYDPLLNAPGVYTYTVQGSAPCPNDQGQVTVTENAAPFAGTDALLTICATVAPVDLFVLLGGAQAGGSWAGPLGGFSGVFDPAVDGSGAYVYTVSGAAPCPSDQATVQVTEEPPPFAGADPALTVCAGGAPVALGVLLTGADPGGSWTDPNGAPFTGSLDPGIAPAGAYTYTVSGVLCPADQAVVQVTIEPGADAGGDAVLGLCADAPPVDLFTQITGTPDAGGTWWGPGGGAYGAVLDPATASGGAYVYVVPGTVTCPADSATLLVSIAQPADAGSPATIALCSTDAPLDLFAQLGGAPDAGGAWTDPSGVTCNAVIDPATAIAGTYTYAVSAAPPCTSAEATVVVSITPVPQAGITLNGQGGCAPVQLVLGTDIPVWGSCLWTVGPFTSAQCGGDTLLLDVPGTYPVALTIDAGNGCTTTVQASAPVEVVGQPVAAFTYAPATITTTAPTVTFQNLSTDAATFQWTFGDLGGSEEVEPTFSFPDALGDAYTVCLTAFTSPACLDTACATLVVEPSSGLFVPNAFSPDGDGVNDRFIPVLLGMAPEGQELLVVDRWGRVLFTTDRPAEGWDGNFAGGDPVPSGVLVWRFTGSDAHSGARVERMGHVTLVR